MKRERKREGKKGKGKGKKGKGREGLIFCPKGKGRGIEKGGKGFSSMPT